jgi:CRISPR-associated protein Cmr4
MFEDACVLFLYAETPLHPGSGASVGLADLPVQREKATGFPIVQPSGVKGVFRDFICERVGINQKKRELEGLRIQLEHASNQQKAQLTAQIREKENELKALLQTSGVQAVFGPETDEADKHSGALSFTEARLLLFPVRSLVGTFAWITCPQVLARLRRDLHTIAGLKAIGGSLSQDLWGEIPSPARGKALVAQASTVADSDNKVVLEEYTFDGEKSSTVDQVAKWLRDYAFPSMPDAQQADPYAYWKDRLYKAKAAKNEGTDAQAESNLVILSDDDFRDFTLFATELITRIRINPATGTVEHGGLWTEEHLPTETLLYTVASATDPRVADDQLRQGDLKENGKGSAKKVLEYLSKWVKGQLVQMGGDATVGRGLVRVQVFNPELVKSGTHT